MKPRNITAPISTRMATVPVTLATALSPTKARSSPTFPTTAKSGANGPVPINCSTTHTLSPPPFDCPNPCPGHQNPGQWFMQTYKQPMNIKPLHPTAYEMYRAHNDYITEFGHLSTVKTGGGKIVFN